MAEIIGQFNGILTSALNLNATNELKFSSVRGGSIFGDFKNLISVPSDDSIRNLEFKKIIGSYVHKCWRAFIDWLSEIDKIVEDEGYLSLMNRIMIEAAGTNVNPLPIYKNLLISDLRKIIKLVDTMAREEIPGQKVELSVDTENFKFPVKKIESVDKMPEIETGNFEGVLSIKKPDFLGDSLWEFYYQNRRVVGHMLDQSFLNGFRKGELVLVPGSDIYVTGTFEAPYQNTAKIDVVKVVSHYKPGEQQKIL
jgi:hypothetical protein